MTGTPRRQDESCSFHALRCFHNRSQIEEDVPAIKGKLGTLNHHPLSDHIALRMALKQARDKAKSVPLSLEPVPWRGSERRGGKHYGEKQASGSH